MKGCKYYRGVHELEKYLTEVMFESNETNEPGKIRAD